MITVQSFLKNLLQNPKTTAAGIGAILALCGVAPAGYEEKIALVLIAAGVITSADAKSGASGTDK